MSKPVGLLIAGLGMTVSGAKVQLLMILGLLVLFLGVIFIVAYFLSKRTVTLGIIVDSGTTETLKLKASTAQFEELQEVAAILEELVRAETPSAGDGGGKGKSQATASHGAAAGAAAAPSRPPQVETISCPSCQTNLQISSAHRGQKIRCPACREVVQL
jgi:hypothetical protein